jgi:hypothetical protein
MDFAFFAIAFNIKKMCAKIAKEACKVYNRVLNALKTTCFEIIHAQNRMEWVVEQIWVA